MPRAHVSPSLLPQKEKKSVLRLQVEDSFSFWALKITQTVFSRCEYRHGGNGGGLLDAGTDFFFSESWNIQKELQDINLNYNELSAFS